MPLKFKAMNEMGCVIKPRANIIPKNEQALGRIYSLEELEVKSSMAQNPYLPTGSFEKLYLIHTYQGSRHLLSFFNFMTS